MKAAEYGHVECVKVLAPLERGMENQNGKTALMTAAACGHLECVKTLAPLEKGMQDKHGETALMYAANCDRSECIKFLASNEAGMRDNIGKTAMMRLAKNGNIVSFLFPFEAGIADNNLRNQTCRAIYDDADVIIAIRLEKTAGWLLAGKTILDAKIGYY